MDTLRINYVDYWSTVPKETFYFTKILRPFYDIIIENDINKCDILFTSVFGNRKQHISHPLKIFYTGENTRPDFVNNRFCFSFNYIDHPNHYRLPIYYTEHNYKRIKQENRHNSEKTDFCCFLVSNPGNSVRNNIFTELNKYKKVNSGGKTMNNIGYLVPIENTIEWQSKHKFTISCENTKYNGYITEKIVNAYNSGNVPIYWGSDTVKDELNPKSFINVNDFSNTKELIEYISEVDQDDKLYKEIYDQPLLRNNEYNIEFTEESIAKKIKDLLNEGSNING